MARPLLWLPWERTYHPLKGIDVSRDWMGDVVRDESVTMVAADSMDCETRGHIRAVAEAVAGHSHVTADEFEERVYRLIGWTCKGVGNDGR